MKPQPSPTPSAKEISIKPKSASPFWEEVNQFVKSIEKQAYQFFEARGRVLGHDMEDWFKAEKELFKPMTVDISEKDDMVSIRAETPGFKAEELEISLEPDRVTIKGEQKTETEKQEEKVHYEESRSRKVFRILILPMNVVADKGEATLEDGVLEIKAPKAPEAKKMEVKAA